MIEPDNYFKKTIDFWHSDQDLQFRVAQDLFSSHQVDTGTRFLLDTVTDSPQPIHKVLDLGCGYGPIGLTLKKADTARVVHMVDRDALALAYTRQNAHLNAIPEVAVYGSLGYDDVADQDFDLIISNIPGKAGEGVITALLQDAAFYLKPAGWVAIVVVAPLAPLVNRVLAASDVDVLLQEAGADHAVYHYRFTERGTRSAPQGALDRGVYQREELRITYKEITYPIKTAYGLPEFDSLSYQSELLLRGLLDYVAGPVNRALVFTPGQGHIPVSVWTQAHPAHIALVDRDLLSLRYARLNLVLNACPADAIELAHQVGLRMPEATPVDLIMGLLEKGHTQETLAPLLQDAVAQLAKGGNLLVAASSTTITRLETLVRAEKALRVVKRKRSKGNSLLVLRKRGRKT